MFRPLYDKVLQWAGHRHALWVMGVVSFLESSIFPIPPDVMLVPMVLADRRRAFAIAFVCTVTSVLGGLLGYAIGYWLLETAGAWLIRTYSLGAALEEFRRGFEQYGTWIILVKGLTPIPYKLVTIASGAAHFDLFTFIWASVLTRGARFYLLAALLWRFGEPIRAFIERRLEVLTWTFLAALIGGFVAVRYLT
jgi:membrane protein YqaA with SNARE-associated domain